MIYRPAPAFNAQSAILTILLRIRQVNGTGGLIMAIPPVISISFNRGFVDIRILTFGNICSTIHGP